MRKIVIVTSNIAPYRLRWAEELAKYYDVTMVYTKDHDFERDDRWLQKESNVCKLVKLKNENNTYDPLCLDIIDFIKHNKDSLFIFDGYGPKTNLLGLLYCKIHHMRTIANLDGYVTDRNSKQLKHFLRSIALKVFCDYFTCGGENVKNYLIDHGINKDKIIVHNFSSIVNDQIIKKKLSKKDKDLLKEKLGIVKDKKIVLGVGRFLPLKRFEDLIKAVIESKTACELYILGGTPSKEYLETIGNNKNIHFIDFVLPKDVFDYYKVADVMVLPSETEVWGLVLNEAMSQGLPVIASDSVVGGYNLIKDNGYIFETYNINQLSECILKCLDEENNKKMSKASLDIIKNFTIEGMIERQIPLINKLLNN